MPISQINTNSIANGAVVAADLAAGAARANFGAGAVLQVVNATYSVQTSTTSSSFGDTGLSASITPTSATSKILILVNQSGCQKGGDNTVALQLLRNSTSILLFDRGGDTGESTANNYGSSGCNYLDSPSTTSSTTYKTQFRSSAPGSVSFVQAGSTTSISSITLMEIAA